MAGPLKRTRVLFLALSLVWAAAQAQTTFDLTGSKGSYADIDDISMYYEIYGLAELRQCLPEGFSA